MDIAILLIVAYFVGNMLTATVVGKLFYQKDIRSAGSGNPGARNAGRVFGKAAFTIVFLGDALKGVLIVLLAKWMGVDEWIQLMCVLVVMAGHVFPIIYKFRGGQGVSTFIGGMLAFHPLVVACFVVVFLVLYPFLKNFSSAGLSAMALSPLFLFGLTKEWPQTIAAILVVAFLLFAYWKDSFSIRKGYREN
ncbi:glycerol-3-phosphate acyltransferase [Sporosarcina sp. SAFN-015]|uniref:glycerol-3-phosphate acyltransferase n=1 Tax=Sporosarcina sp. SAFN-015 TaxID=3387274 RepID=UPI003F7E457E